MKQLQQFQCEICGTVYNSERVASECENNHKIIDSIMF